MSTPQTRQRTGFFGLAAICLLLELSAAQSPTGNLTLFTDSTSNVDQVFVEVYGSAATEAWIRVNETDAHDEVRLTSEYLSTYDNAGCTYGAGMEGSQLVARSVGEGKRCDMRFILEVGKVQGHYITLELNVQDGGANIEVMSGTTSVVVYRMRAATTRFLNDPSTSPDQVYVESTANAFIEGHNLWVIDGDMSGRSKVYHVPDQARECPALICSTYPKSEVHYHSHGASGANHDIRSKLATATDVFVGGGENVTKSVTDHTTVDSADSAEYVVDFHDAVSGQTVKVTIGKTTGSHISANEKPKFDDPASQSFGKRAATYSISTLLVSALLMLTTSSSS